MPVQCTNRSACSLLWLKTLFHVASCYISLFVATSYCSPKPMQTAISFLSEPPNYIWPICTGYNFERSVIFTLKTEVLEINEIETILAICFEFRGNPWTWKSHHDAYLKVGQGWTEVLSLAAHILKLRRRRDYHGPCVRMTHKFMECSIYF